MRLSAESTQNFKHSNRKLWILPKLSIKERVNRDIQRNTGMSRPGLLNDKGQIYTLNYCTLSDANIT